MSCTSREREGQEVGGEVSCSQGQLIHRRLMIPVQEGLACLHRSIIVPAWASIYRTSHSWAR